MPAEDAVVEDEDGPEVDGDDGLGVDAVEDGDAGERSPSDDEASDARGVFA